MSRLFIVILGFTLISGCETGAANASDPGEEVDVSEFSMGDFEWSHRPLVIFVSGDAPEPDGLRDRIDDAWADIVERDMVAIWVYEERVEVRAKDGARTHGSKAATALRKRFDPEGNRVFLVGKDGGVKQKGDYTIELADVFARIDSMPMRQREMRRREK